MRRLNIHRFRSRADQKSATQFRAYKVAKHALRDGDTRTFGEIALTEIPRLLDSSATGRTIGQAVRDWVMDESSYDDAKAMVEHSLSDAMFLPGTYGKLAKWFLSCGMFTAALQAEEIAAASLDGARPSDVSVAKWEKWRAAVAVQSSDRLRLQQIVDDSNPLSLGPERVNFTDVARVALGLEPRHELVEPWFREIVKGKTIGVLGPAPLDDSDREAILRCDIVAITAANMFDGKLRIPEYAQLVYTMCPVSNAVFMPGWDGVVMNRISWENRKPRGFKGRLRRPQMLEACGLVSHPTSVPDIIIDLLLAGASKIVGGGADFYIGGPLNSYATDALKGYLGNDDGKTPAFVMGRAIVSGAMDHSNCCGAIAHPHFRHSSMFGSHSPLENRNLVRTAALSGRVEARGAMRDALEISNAKAVCLLESRWGRERW